MASDVDIPFPTRELRLFLRELTRVEIQLRLLAAGHLEALAPELPRAPEALRDRLAAQIAGTAQRARREGYGGATTDVALLQSILARIGDRALAATGVGRGALGPLAADFPRPPLTAEDTLDQIDDLLDAAPPHAELAELYLLALAAGVEPESEDPERQARLAVQRRALFDQVAARRPDLMVPAGSQLFPDAYRQSQGNGQVRYMPQVRGWLAALVVALAGLLLFSHWAFRDATRDIGPAVDTPPRCETGCP